MKLTFNTEKLDKILADFYNCTQITITLFDSELKCISTAGIIQPYCNVIRCDPALLGYCNCSDVANADKARAQKSTLIYTCHAGIVESVTPIFYDNTLIAYLMLGKLRDSDEKYSSPALVREVAEKYGLDEKEMLENYTALPVRTKDYLDSAISILEACISYIWSENIIRLQRSTLSAQLETYILENLSSEISVDALCKEFFVSRQTLYSIFKNEFDDTVRNFILKKRMQKAEQLLAGTKLSIANIAAEVGFSDYNYFIRFFKKKLGISPLQYRKNAAKHP